MSKLTKALVLSAGLALAGAAAATPALAQVDFRFGVDIGPSPYYGPYYRPYAPYYYSPYYWHPHGRYYDYR